MIEHWKKAASKPLGDYRIFTVRSDIKISPRTGEHHDFFVIDCVDWVNVIATTPDDQIVVDQSPDLVNPNFINLIDALPAADRYSFVFEGTPQALVADENVRRLYLGESFAL